MAEEAVRTQEDGVHFTGHTMLVRDEWEPIEMAPRNGSDVLGTNGVWYEVLFWDGHLWCRHFDSGSAFKPTHWMPLPEPPK